MVNKVKMPLNSHERPMTICLDYKYHGHDISKEGLMFMRNFKESQDVDYRKCLKTLLKFEAEPNYRIEKNPLMPFPIFHVLEDLEMLIVLLSPFPMEKRKEIVNQLNSEGDSPLTLLC